MIATVLLVSLVSGLLGVVLGAQFRKHKPGELEAEVQDLQTEKAQLEYDLRWAREGRDRSQSDAERMRKQRDDYAKIASSHEVTYPEKGKPVEVWGNRRYSDHPEKNLVDLQEDLAEFKGKDLKVAIELVGVGGWDAILKEAWKQKGHRGLPTVPKSTLKFEGSPDRVIRQIGTFLLDDDSGFARKGKRTGGEEQPKKWKDEDSPTLWSVDLEITDMELPSVHKVEVLRIQEEVRDRIVEKPVAVQVPEEVSTALCGHTDESLTSLINAVLEIRDLERPERLIREKLALASLEKGLPEAVDKSSSTSSQGEEAAAKRRLHAAAKQRTSR